MCMIASHCISQPQLFSYTFFTIVCTYHISLIIAFRFRLVFIYMVLMHNLVVQRQASYQTWIQIWIDRSGSCCVHRTIKGPPHWPRPRLSRNLALASMSFGSAHAWNVQRCCAVLHRRLGYNLCIFISFCFKIPYWKVPTMSVGILECSWEL
jgi:hypothetical protein